MANGNGQNGARGAYEDEIAKRSRKRPYEELKGRIKDEIAKRPPEKDSKEQCLAKQQAAMQRRRPSGATQVEQARAAELLLPEERFDRTRRSRRRTARAGRGIEQQRRQPRGRRIRL